jgi:diguanylate cyclase (GGDEF)-like protein/PAS domain S-box-containing protein
LLDKQEQSEWDTRKPRVLAVDDSPINLSVLVHLLRRKYEVTVATSGREALAAAQQHTFDMILLDIMMPEMDGFETLRQLQMMPNFNATPVIFLTAADDPQTELAGLQLGAADYITKPFNVDLVGMRIANLMQRTRLQNELELALASADQGLWEWHLGLDRVRFDTRSGVCLDVPADAAAGTGMAWSEICHPDDHYRIQQALLAYLDGAVPVFEGDVRLRTRDGHWLWINIYGKASEHDTGGNVVRVKGAYRNVAARKAAEEALRQGEERLRFVMEATGEGIWDWQVQSGHVTHNASWCRILGLDQAHLMHPLDFFTDLIHPDDAERFQSAVKNCLAGQADYLSEHRLRHADGSYVWVLDRGKVVEHSADGVPLRMVGSIKDISDRKAAEAEILKMAFHDVLTGLPNRRLLVDRMQQTIAKNERTQGLAALLFLDLDRFKELNDTLGHDIGDLLLMEVARRLQQCVREHDTVARLGGDEFVVMLNDLGSSVEPALDNAAKVGNKVLESLNQPYQLGAHRYQSTPSIGLTLFGGKKETVDAVLKRADNAMYSAKAAGRNRLQVADQAG